MYRLAIGVALASLTTLSAIASAADYRFVENASGAGLVGYARAPGMGSGIAAADYDQDGDPDLFIPTAMGTPNRLYRNLGDGNFEEVAGSVGLADTRQAKVALWVDYDGDGDLDLAVGRDCIFSSGNCNDVIISMYEQDNGIFTDISVAVGFIVTVSQLSNGLHVGGLSAGDVSGDGLPDIYFARWQATPELFVSDGLLLRGDKGGYLYAGSSSGVGSLQAGHWQGLIQDLDGDHWPDLFVNVDFLSNQLWVNNQDQTFNNVAVSAGVDTAWNEMGLASADYDGDGDLDFYITNIHDWVDPQQMRRNRLYRNDSTSGNLSFTDVSQAEGVDDTDWGWGTVWFDADNDGDLELAATNGYCQDDYCDDEHLYDPSRFYDRDAGAYSDVSNEVGFNDTLVGGSLINVDVNLDGRLDMLQTAVDDQGMGHLRLLMNEPTMGAPEHHFIVIKPRPGTSNSHGLGAVVRVVLDDGTTMMRHITAGSSFLGQEPARAHFGIGANTHVRRVEVDWPNSEWTSVWAGPHVDRVHTLCCPDTRMVDGFE